MQKLIDDLFLILSNYMSMQIFYREFTSHEVFQLKTQTSFNIFQHFILFAFLQIIVDDINIQNYLKRNKVFPRDKSWQNIIVFEIEAFIEVLFYMRIFVMSRITDDWNHDFKRVIHAFIINCMSNQWWEQIKRNWKFSISSRTKR